MSDKRLTIRNSTAEFLIFTSQANEDGIEVRVEDENVWLTQKLIAKLFDVHVATLNEHLKNIFNSGELEDNSVIRKFLITANDGKKYNTKHYNLETIIALGYRISSEKATDFRRWATRVLKDFAIRGYVIDNIRLKNGAYLSKQYFKDLILEIRDIRESERNFYQQITDIYSTAMDYDLKSPTTKAFFANVQNKLHFAVHGHTAAELIIDRANYKKDYMGLKTWKKAPDGKIIKSDVVTAKNYLNGKEIKALNRIVTMYLDYAEDQAENGIPMTMKDWAVKLNAFLQFNNKELLENFGKVTAVVAKSFVNSMSDLFHEKVPESFIFRIFDVMKQAHWHQFQILTKRSARLRELAQEIDWPENVWIGVSVENKTVKSRIDDLRDVPAAIRFLSLEPLLGPLEHLNLSNIDWVIVGGESGPGARQMKKEWVMQIKKQCIEQNTPFYFKQWGGVHKKKTGRLLEGRKWDEMPVYSTLSSSV